MFGAGKFNVFDSHLSSQFNACHSNRTLSNKSQSIREVTQTRPACTVSLEIGNQTFLCEIDTGACCSVIPSKLYHEFFAHCTLSKISDKEFTGADGTRSQVLGKIVVAVNKT